MKYYTIFGGVNGVGKTSFTGVLARTDSNLGVIIDTDKLIKAEVGKISGGKSALGIISHCLEEGLSFSQETTLAGKRTLKTVQAAKNKGYYIRLFYVALSSAEESLLRIENRVRKGGHDIPREDVIRRFQNRFEDLVKILPCCDEVHFFDNENGFVFVGEYLKGKVVTSGNYIPQWVINLKKYTNS